MVRPVSSLEEIDQQRLRYICQDSAIASVYELAKDFGMMVRARQVELLDAWLVRCQHCSVVFFEQFGLRLHRIAEATRL